jgi:hypothetical protein
MVKEKRGKESTIGKAHSEVPPFWLFVAIPPNESYDLIVNCEMRK